MTNIDQLPGLQIQYEHAKETVAELEGSLTVARDNLKKAQAASELSDFDRVMRGEMPSKLADLESEVTHLERLIKGGNDRVSSLWSQISNITKAEQERVEAAMTFDDAIDFARDALAAIDVKAAKRKIADIEAKMRAAEDARFALVEPLHNAKEVRAEASLHGRDDAYVKADEACRKLEEKMADAREQLIVARERHPQALNEMRAQNGRAFRHVTRLLNAHADELEKRVKDVRALAGALGRGLNGAKALRPLDEQPPFDALARAIKLRDPVIELSYCSPPPQRPESDFHPTYTVYNRQGGLRQIVAV